MDISQCVSFDDSPIHPPPPQAFDGSWRCVNFMSSFSFLLLDVRCSAFCSSYQALKLARHFLLLPVTKINQLIY